MFQNCTALTTIYGDWVKKIGLSMFLIALPSSATAHTAVRTLTPNMRVLTDPAHRATSHKDDVSRNKKMFHVKK